MLVILCFKSSDGMVHLGFAASSMCHIPYVSRADACSYLCHVKLAGSQYSAGFMPPVGACTANLTRSLTTHNLSVSLRLGVGQQHWQIAVNERLCLLQADQTKLVRTTRCGKSGVMAASSSPSQFPRAHSSLFHLQCQTRLLGSGRHGTLTIGLGFGPVG